MLEVSMAVPMAGMRDAKKDFHWVDYLDYRWAVQKGQMKVGLKVVL
jgi:hypothetical protein